MILSILSLASRQELEVYHGTYIYLSMRSLMGQRFQDFVFFQGQGDIRGDLTFQVYITWKGIATYIR